MGLSRRRRETGRRVDSSSPGARRFAYDATCQDQQTLAYAFASRRERHLSIVPARFRSLQAYTRTPAGCSSAGITLPPASAFGEKAIAVLKDAADGVVRGTPWPSSRTWFERIVDGLEKCGWPGAALHRQLANAGLFESIEMFCDDGSDPEAGDRVEALFEYLHAAYEDDLQNASNYIARLTEFLHPQGDRHTLDSTDPTQIPFEL